MSLAAVAANYPTDVRSSGPDPTGWFLAFMVGLLTLLAGGALCLL